MLRSIIAAPALYVAQHFCARRLKMER